MFVCRRLCVCAFVLARLFVFWSFFATVPPVVSLPPPSPPLPPLPCRRRRSAAAVLVLSSPGRVAGLHGTVVIVYRRPQECRQHSAPVLDSASFLGVSPLFGSRRGFSVIIWGGSRRGPAVPRGGGAVVMLLNAPDGSVRGSAVPGAGDCRARKGPGWLRERPGPNHHSAGFGIQHAVI